eukprot:1159641-Pelagomonas_calceolata.AAC.10
MIPKIAGRSIKCGSGDHLCRGGSIAGSHWSGELPSGVLRTAGTAGSEPTQKKKASENTPNINCGKGDTLAQRAVKLPHHRERGKQVWVWRGSGSTRPQGTRVIMSAFSSKCRASK